MKITTGVILLLIDQITKYAFYNKNLLSEIFVPVLNTGAAWSINISPAIIYMVAICMSGWLIYTYHQKRINPRIVALFLAGIRGNIIDRSLHEGVRDFIYVADRYPIFNMADIYITLAALRIGYTSIIESNHSSGQQSGDR